MWLLVIICYNDKTTENEKRSNLWNILVNVEKKKKVE